MASRGAKRSAQGDANLKQQIDDFLKSADGLFSTKSTESFAFSTLSKQERPFRTVPIPKDSSSSKVARIAVQVSYRPDIERSSAYQSNTPTFSTSEDSDSDEIKQRGPYADAKMRIGRDYQAAPSNLVGRPGSRCQSPDRALCVWTPVPECDSAAGGAALTDNQVASFVDLARDRFGYSTEQALGMLYWHKHSVDMATADLPNFIPYPDEWTHEEKVVFDQAFSFQGKQFHKIIHALPDKSVPHLVKYYYQWKKTRAKTSLMERRGQLGDDSGSECSDGELPELRPGCRRIRRPQQQPQQQRQNDKRPEMQQESSALDADSRQQQKRKLPRGIFLDYESLLAMSGQGRGRASAVVDALDAQLASARSRVQRNRAQLTQRWESLLSQIQAYQEPDPEGQISFKWTDEELLLAVQGVRRYGKDFRSIAQLIGSKTESHVRCFFAQYRSKFGLDSVLAEYNKECGAK